MFLDFIDGNFYDSHVLPQVNFLKDKGLQIDDIDVILLHNNLQSDFDKLIKDYPQIKITGALPTAQVGNKAIKDKVTKFVENNKHIQDKINKVYHDDYMLYNSIKK